MTLRRVAAPILAFLLVALAAACTTATPAATTASQAAAAQESETAAPSAEQTAEPAATPEDASSDVCTVDDMPDLSSGWAFLEGLGGSYRLAYPDDWEDLSGEGEFIASSLLDEETFDELGRDTDATIRSDFVRAPATVPNLSVFIFGPVDSSTSEIREREVARYEELDDLERMVDTTIEACVGGTPAIGASLEFESTDGQTYYQQNLFLVREGELHVIQWLDFADEPDLDLLNDIISTWGWTLPSDEPTGTGGIAEARMASEVDTSLAAPDPSTYVTSFPADAAAIYVVFRMEAGAEGTVALTWLVDGEEVFEDTIPIADTEWAYGGITPAPGGFQPGNYTVRLELNDDVETLDFTVEPAS